MPMNWLLCAGMSAFNLAAGLMWIALGADDAWAAAALFAFFFATLVRP